MNLVVSASAAWNVCNEIFYPKSKNAITRLAAGSANIIMLQRILDERFTFLHPLVRRLLLPQAGCELYRGRDYCLLKSHNWLHTVSKMQSECCIIEYAIPLKTEELPGKNVQTQPAEN